MTDENSMFAELLARLWSLEGEYTRADLTQLLSEYKRRRGKKYKGPAAADALCVALSEELCAEAASDREAEFVRRGLRLGYYLALLNRNEFFRAGVRSNQKKGSVTKSLKTRERDAVIQREYKLKEKSIGDLRARQELRDSHNLTLHRINDIVKPLRKAVR
jgi:hypothetical protein